MRCDEFAAVALTGSAEPAEVHSFTALAVSEKFPDSSLTV